MEAVNGKRIEIRHHRVHPELRRGARFVLEHPLHQRDMPVIDMAVGDNMHQLPGLQAGRDFAVATIAEALGSTPRTNGKMIVYADGTTLGTVGGGAAELQVTKDAVAQIKRGCNVLHHYNVGAETADDGMQCGGKLSVLIEVYRANPLLVVVGGGHVGRCLIRVAKQTGFDVLLFDDRPAEAVPESAALADRFIRVTDFAQDICAADVPAGAYFVICGHSHADDGIALKAALTKQAAYVGMLGSRRKMEALFTMLREQGVTEAQLAAVHTPIGLDLGGETPPEIAIAILAEILQVKNGLA